jgi:hypothetical protein
MESNSTHPLPFFPALLPDESLHSLISRYHRLSGNPQERQTLHDIFGTHLLVATANLPSHLPNLCAALPEHAEHSLDQLIDQCTLLPYFSPFLEARQIAACRHAMTSHNAGGMKIGIGLTASRIGGRNAFRYCPQCCVEDARLYGAAYWHRSHSLPGVLLCHRHGCVLAELRADLITLRRHSLFLPPDSWVEAGSSFPPIQELPRNDLLHLAASSAELLEMRMPPIPRSLLRCFYREHATRQGWIDRNGRIERATVLHVLCHAGLAQNAGPDLTFCRLPHWVFKLLYKHRTAMHPLKHLTLMTLLDTSPRALLAYCEGSDTSDGAGATTRTKTTVKTETNPAPSDGRRQRFLDQLSNTNARRAQDYMWLYKHDRQWLRETISLNVKSHASSGDKVVWHVRDSEFAEQIRQQAALLYQSNVKMRISASRLARATGKQALIEKFSRKLPITMQAIHDLEETVDAYQCRRLRAIVQESRAKGVPLVRWRLLRTAGLTCPLAPQVEKLLSILIQSS